eukprot:m.221361 g.221361  ORF g.221361 m.221361 type:complete len:114 (-) comp10569_c0_seq1:85-426(-)
MGKLFLEYLNDPKVYICASCNAHLACFDDLISKSFQGRLGRAFLFRQVVNIESGPVQEKMLLTGRHRIADVHCSTCKAYLGWRYEQAFEQEQKYKEGKVILEKTSINKETSWD